MPRYLVRAGSVTCRTPGGSTHGELWFGIEVAGPVNLEFLSRHGYELTPCDGMSPAELQSVGVEVFERIEVEVE